MLQGAHVARAHQASDQTTHVIVAHGPLELSGAHRRVTQPARGGDRPFGQWRVLQKRYLENGRHVREGGLLALLSATVFLIEPLNPPGSVDQLLLARIERMAGGAYLDFDLRQGRAGHEGLAARARYSALNIFRMYIVLQGASSDTSCKVIGRKDTI